MLRVATLGQLIQVGSDAFQYSYDARPVEANVLRFFIGVWPEVHNDVIAPFQLVQPADALA